MELNLNTRVEYMVIEGREKMAQTGIQKVLVTWSYTEGIIVTAEVESRTRKGVIHYTRLILDPTTLTVKKSTCSCEAYVFGKVCWHVKALKNMTTMDAEVREEIEKAVNEMKRAEDTAFWG